MNIETAIEVLKDLQGITIVTDENSDVFIQMALETAIATMTAVKILYSVSCTNHPDYSDLKGFEE